MTWNFQNFPIITSGKSGNPWNNISLWNFNWISHIYANYSIFHALYVHLPLITLAIWRSRIHLRGFQMTYVQWFIISANLCTQITIYFFFTEGTLWFPTSNAARRRQLSCMTKSENSRGFWERKSQPMRIIRNFLKQNTNFELRVVVHDPNSYHPSHPHSLTHYLL